MNILVAERNPAAQRVLANMLAYNGHAAAWFAGSWMVVLDTLEASSVDMVLADAAVVTDERCKLLKELYSSEQADQAPLLVMVHADQTDTIEQLAKRGVRHFITRPFSADLLGERIEQVMREGPVVPSEEELAAQDEGVEEPRPADELPVASEEQQARAREELAQGKQHLDQEDYTAAAAAFTRALQADGRLVEAQQGLIVAFYHQGLTEQALRLGERAMQLFPDSASMACTVARLYAKSGDRDTARALLQPWLAKDEPPAEAVKLAGKLNA
jgi:two-component system chemotaxis response regulator CheY